MSSGNHIGLVGDSEGHIPVMTWVSRHVTCARPVHRHIPCSRVKIKWDRLQFSHSSFNQKSWRHVGQNFFFLTTHSWLQESQPLSHHTNMQRTEGMWMYYSIHSCLVILSPTCKLQCENRTIQRCILAKCPSFAPQQIDDLFFIWTLKDSSEGIAQVLGLWLRWWWCDRVWKW